MKLLALDTSTRATVLGLKLDGEVIERTTPAVNSHSREILPSIERLLADGGLSLSELDGIVFGRGPGSFTGLRIAAGVVQGLAYGANLPVVPVSSMAVLARSASREAGVNRVLVILTARLEEVYFGGYTVKGEDVKTTVAEGVLDVRELPPIGVASKDSWIIAGNALALATSASAATGVEFRELIECEVPPLDDLVALGALAFSRGETVSALEAEPVYLREEVASRPSGA